MAKKQFKAESKRLLDLMIGSIYTHKEIFLREIISNASDAVDKLAYIALTDEKVGLARGDFEIRITADSKARTLTISDNGVGMSKEELESNLGTIARSGSLQFKKELAEKEGDSEDVSIIGQFGVGFYSAFMVSDSVCVTSRAYGSDEAWQWSSTGADGYTMTSCEKAGVGTDIVMHIKEDADGEDYCQYLDPYKISALIKKYSDYVRYPIRMEMEKSRMKEKPADAKEDYKPEWESYTELTTLNSMVPLWQRPKSEVTAEESDSFYKEKFGDFEPPLSTLRANAEGAVSYKALLYIPAKAPYNYYTRDFAKGLSLYSSGVMIMENCAELIPDHFSFVRGVVDSQDFSLNISREMLQQTRQLKVISVNIEKKIKAELARLLADEREKYETFWKSFGAQLKYGVVAEYGAHKELLSDLLLFNVTGSEKPLTLAEYVAKMPENQKYIYFAAGENVATIASLPQAERITAAGFQILCLTEEADEFVMQILHDVDGKEIKSVDADDALPESEEDKADAAKQSEDNKDLLEFVKKTLGERVAEVKISKKLLNHPVCLSADGPISIEMEKYFKSVSGGADAPSAKRVLELNPDSAAFAALADSFTEEPKKAEKYVEILYGQAMLIAGIPLPNPAEYSDLVCSLIK